MHFLFYPAQFVIRFLLFLPFRQSSLILAEYTLFDHCCLHRPTLYSILSLRFKLFLICSPKHLQLRFLLFSLATLLGYRWHVFSLPLGPLFLILYFSIFTGLSFFFLFFELRKDIGLDLRILSFFEVQMEFLGVERDPSMIFHRSLLLFGFFSCGAAQLIGLTSQIIVIKIFCKFSALFFITFFFGRSFLSAFF